MPCGDVEPVAVFGAEDVCEVAAVPFAAVFDAPPGVLTVGETKGVVRGGAEVDGAGFETGSVFGVTGVSRVSGKCVTACLASSAERGGASRSRSRAVGGTATAVGLIRPGCLALSDRRRMREVSAGGLEKLNSTGSEVASVLASGRGLSGMTT